MTLEDFVEDVKNIRRYAMKGKWVKVLEMFEKKQELRTAKITRTGDTILHMAVSSGKEDVVKSMVDFVCGEGMNEPDEKSLFLSPMDENGNEQKLALGTKNQIGNTPLHLAASMGNVDMCKMIGCVDPSLVAKRNIAGETPLFMAVLHGKKKAFLFLHYLYIGSPQGSSPEDAYYKRDDNDTILHCALAQGHIDLAIDIILLYKHHLAEMAHMRNKNGLSPLHLLAATPSAFKSTDLPGQSFVAQFLYHWYFRVKEKKQATTREELELLERSPCISGLMYALLKYVIPRAGFAPLLMTPNIGDIIVLLPCFVAYCLLVPLGALEELFVSPGNWFHGIRKMKEKHTWSLQIMNKLLLYASDEDISANPYDEYCGKKIYEISKH